MGGGDPVPETPRFPRAQWVCVPEQPRGYEGQWREALRLLAARRRIQDFAAVPEEQWRCRTLCSLAPRWPAEPSAPPGLPDHERNTPLSAVGWVKRRRWQAESLARQAGLLGTARAPRTAREAQEALERLRPLAETGRKAARDLSQAMEGLPRTSGAPPLASYLAVVVQDLDGIGLFLSGRAGDSDGRRIEVDPNEHRRVSQDLLRVAARQRTALREATLLGVPVYAGGDDLLAFTPASRALGVAETCHDAIPPALPRASTAVLFFHYHASIQQAMSEEGGHAARPGPNCPATCR